MLRLTGFVLPDVGILTITAFAGKSDPEQVTREDLDGVADYLEDLYSQPMGKYLAGSLAFTTNGGFTQPGWSGEKYEYKRKAYANFVLRGHQNNDLEPVLAALDERGKTEYRDMVLRGVPDAPRCAFTGEPAYLRVSRDMLPMLNGRGIMNFGPMGAAGLPVSDVILLAIHAMPLGCIVSQGALLAVESNDTDLMAAFVRANVDENRRFINLASQNDYEKYPNLSAYKSRLITVLVEALSKQQQQGEEYEKRGEQYRMPSLTAYHFTNYGSKASVKLYSLPSATVEFIYNINEGRHKPIWQRIVASGWTQDKEESEELNSKTPKLTRRNFIYEDLFELPAEARKFLRTYFLRRPLKAFKRDPRAEYNLFTEADLVSWELTALFLRSIMNMEKSRIDAISELGTRLADYIQTLDRRKLLQTLYKGGKYHQFRTSLLRAIQDYARYMPAGSEPLVSLEGYIKIFEEADEFALPDWRLAYDLLLIRIFEQLHRSGYLSKAADDLQKAEDEADEVSAD